MDIKSFDLKKNCGGIIECVMTTRSSSVKFMFEEKLNINKTEESQILKIDTTTDIKNPIGFIIGRMQRIAEINSHITAIVIDGKEIELTDNFVDADAVTEVVSVGGFTIPEGGSLSVSVFDAEGNEVHTRNYKFNDCISSGSFLGSPKAFSVPMKKDGAGNPRYTRNEVINAILYSAQIPVGDDAKKYAKLLSNGMYLLKELGEQASAKELTSISSDVIEHVCNLSKKKFDKQSLLQTEYHLRARNNKGKYRFPVEALIANAPTPKQKRKAIND